MGEVSAAGGIYSTVAVFVACLVKVLAGAWGSVPLAITAFLNLIVVVVVTD